MLKNTLLKKSIKGILYGAALFTTVSQATVWCDGGTIVQIGDVHWGESSIVANYPGSIPGDIPPWVVDQVDHHITYTAAEEYSNGFVGGGGGFGGYSVPNSGQVKVVPYAPHNYITAPSLYSISEGVKFKLKKCYTIPPMTAIKELYDFALPWKPGINDNPISIKPADRLPELESYWEQGQR